MSEIKSELSPEGTFSSIFKGTGIDPQWSGVSRIVVNKKSEHDEIMDKLRELQEKLDEANRRVKDLQTYPPPYIPYPVPVPPAPYPYPYILYDPYLYDCPYYIQWTYTVGDTHSG